MNWNSLKNPYGALSLALVLTSVGLAVFSVQGAFVALLLITVAAGLRLLHTGRQTARDQLAVSREIASWLGTIHRSGLQPNGALTNLKIDSDKPQA